MGICLLLILGVVLPSASAGGAPAELPAVPGPATGAAPLSIVQFLASPSTFVISNPVWLNVTASGGAPPYSYCYAGLPSGCPSMNVSALACQPREVNHFTVEVTVNDSNGSQVSSSVSFTVTSGYRGPPVIQSIEIAPNPLPLGQVADIQVDAISVSNSTLAYFYFDLPPGCYSFNQTPLECLPSAPGSYDIGIQVTDAFGQPVQSHAYLNVTGSLAKSSDSGAVPAFVLYVTPVIVIALAIVVAVVLFGRGRRRGPPKPFLEPPKP